MATLKEMPIKSKIGKRWQVVVEWRKTTGDKDFVTHLVRETKLSKHVVQHAIKLYKETSDVVDAPRPGRPRALQPEESQAIAKQVVARKGKRGIVAGQSATRMSKRVPGSKKDGNTKPIAAHSQNGYGRMHHLYIDEHCYAT